MLAAARHHARGALARRLLVILGGGVVAVFGVGACDCGTGNAGEEGGFHDVADADGWSEEETALDGGADSDADSVDDVRETLVAPSPCGNAVLDPGEECDDGNRLNDDGCDWRCAFGDGEDPPGGPPDHAAGRMDADPSTMVRVETGRPDPRSILAGWYRVPLVWTGTEFAFFWTHYGVSAPLGPVPVDGTFMRIDTSGRPVDAPWTYTLHPCVMGGWPRTADMAWTGTGFGLLWQGQLPDVPCPAPPVQRVLFMQLDASGKALAAPVVLGTGYDGSGGFGLAWDGFGFGSTVPLVGDDGASHLGFRRLDTAGRARDAAPTVLTTRPSGRGQARVAWSGIAYLATWLERRDDAEGRPSDPAVVYAVLSREGSVVGSPLAMGTTAGINHGGIVWTGERFAMAWVSSEEGADGAGLYLATLSASGELLGPPRRVVETGSETSLDLAFGHATLAVATTTTACGGWCLLRWDLDGVFVDASAITPPAGSLLDGLIGLASDPGGFGVVKGVIEDDSTDGVPYFLRYPVDHS